MGTGYIEAIPEGNTMRLNLLWLAMGCSNHSTTQDNSEKVIEIPTTKCGESHEWLSTSNMGQITYSEQDEGLTFEKDTINALLISNGLSEFGLVKNGVQTFRVQYTSQDRGEPIEATGFVFLPILDAPQPMPMLMYAHPLMGFSDRCAPTAIGLEGAGVPLLMSAMGFVTVAPDYLNMRGFGGASTAVHPVGLAEPAAVLSLDSLRAALQLAETENSDAQPDPNQVVFWGVSEGGFTTLWSERYRPLYAPEFETVGVVAAIPPTNLKGIATNAVTTLSQSTPALAAVLVGMDQWYESNTLSQFLNPELIDVIPNEMLESCSDFPSVSNAETISDYFSTPFIEAAATENWTGYETIECQLKENSLIHANLETASQTPTLIVTAENDDLAWPEPVHDDIPILCDQGMLIEHIQCAGADHVDGAIDTLPLQLNWIQDRISGVQAYSDCLVNEPIDCSNLSQ